MFYFCFSATTTAAEATANNIIKSNEHRTCASEEQNAVDSFENAANTETLNGEDCATVDSDSDCQRCGYKLSDAFFNQMLEVFATKNAATIETYIAEKLRTLDTSSLPPVAALACAEDTAMLDPAIEWERTKKNGSNAHANAKRPLVMEPDDELQDEEQEEHEDDDVIFLSVSSKKARQEANGHC